MRRAILLIAAAMLLTPASGEAAKGPGAPSVPAGKTKTFGSDGVACGDNGTITWSPTTLWPPNHKLHDITFTYTDPDGGDVSLVVTAKPHSDTLPDGSEKPGAGHTLAATDQSGGANTDSDGSVDVVGTARAERSGKSTGGRTYRYEYVASNDEDGDMQQDDGCASDPDDDTDDLTVTVPHDCRGGACRP